MDTPDPQPVEPVILKQYVCDRCGFRYEKAFDYPPFLCYRCMRFISKRVYTTIKTLTPPVSRTQVDDLS